MKELRRTAERAAGRRGAEHSKALFLHTGPPDTGLLHFVLLHLVKDTLQIALGLHKEKHFREGSQKNLPEDLMTSPMFCTLQNDGFGLY